MNLAYRLRNVPVRQLTQALHRDGFELPQAQPRGSARFFEHSDGRRAFVHFHHNSDTLTLKALTHLLKGTCWILSDAVRLGLIKA